MTLDEAFQVAKAVGDCIDPPVIHGIFKSLNAAFPEYSFALDERGSGDFSVMHISGANRQGNIYK